MNLPMLALFAACLLPLAALASPADDCDRLAAHPYDFANPPSIDGVRFEKLDADRAVPACRAAHEAAPSNPRYTYQLGRATHKAGYPAAAIELYEAAAAANYPRALMTLGLMYHDGILFSADVTKAASYFQKAADLDDPSGLSELAYAYEAGIGVLPDGDKAEALYRRAAATNTEEGIGSLQAWQAKQDLAVGQNCETRYTGDSRVFNVAEEETGALVRGLLIDLDPKIAVKGSELTVRCLRRPECLTILDKGQLAPVSSRSFRVCNAGSAKFLADKLSTLISGRRRGLKGEDLHIVH